MKRSFHIKQTHDLLELIRLKKELEHRLLVEQMTELEEANKHFRMYREVIPQNRDLLFRRNKVRIHVNQSESLQTKMELDRHRRAQTLHHNVNMIPTNNRTSCLTMTH